MPSRKSQSGRKTSRPARRRKSTPNSNSWNFLMAALLVVAIIFAVKACRSNDPELSPGHTDFPASSTSSSHINDLEIARYSDKNAARNAIQKDYEGFTVSFNPQNGTADWVGWELLKEETDGSVKRSDNFWADADVKGSPTPDDYRNSGYDKGHLCPAADQKWSVKAMNDCFVMTNMTPQLHALNGGAWSTLESKERLWAKRDSALVIVAGPIYTESDTTRIGKTGVRVPSAFFKVLLAPYVDDPRAIGFVYPNMSSPGNMQQYSMSVDEVEALTGLDFFANLPDELENRIERSASFTEWNRK